VPSGVDLRAGVTLQRLITANPVGPPFLISIGFRDPYTKKQTLYFPSDFRGRTA
jgi:hypothetical protein